MNILDCINKLEKEGFYCFENLIDKSQLDSLVQLVKEKLSENNNKYFFLADQKLNNTIINDKEFISIFEKIFENISLNLNLKNPNKQEKVSYRYHFDAHLFTVLVPIIIPEREKSHNGDLIIFPNIRKVINSLYLNIIQKIIFQNRFTKFLLKNNYIFKNKSVLLKLKPGNVYIFYGYRTLHGNQSIDYRDVRATLLLHFYDIFNDSKLIKLNRKLRLKNENKTINKNMLHNNN